MGLNAGRKPVRRSTNGVHAVPKYDDGEEPDDLG